MDDAAEGLVERVVLLRDAEARERVRDGAVAEGEEGRRREGRHAGALAELAADLDGDGSVDETSNALATEIFP